MSDEMTLASIDDTAPIPLFEPEETTKSEIVNEDSGHNDEEQKEGEDAPQEEVKPSKLDIISAAYDEFNVDGELDVNKLKTAYVKLKTAKSDNVELPEDISGYSVGDYENIGEDAQTDLATKALEAGVSNDHLDFMLQTIDKLSIAEKPVDKGASLRANWGAEFEEKSALANKAWNKYGGDLDPKLIEDNVGALSLLAKLGEALKEDVVPKNTAGKQVSKSEDVMAQVDKLMASPDYFESLAKQANVAELLNNIK